MNHVVRHQGNKHSQPTIQQTRQTAAHRERQQIDGHLTELAITRPLPQEVLFVTKTASGCNIRAYKLNIRFKLASTSFITDIN